MDELRYPSLGTIKAFGGQSEMAGALGVDRQVVHRWSKVPFIPRWWNERIQAIAERQSVKLPRPKHANGKRA